MKVLSILSFLSIAFAHEDWVAKNGKKTLVATRPGGGKITFTLKGSKEPTHEELEKIEEKIEKEANGSVKSGEDISAEIGRKNGGFYYKWESGSQSSDDGPTFTETSKKYTWKTSFGTGVITWKSESNLSLKAQKKAIKEAQEAGQVNINEKYKDKDVTIDIKIIGEVVDGRKKVSVSWELKTDYKILDAPKTKNWTSTVSGRTVSWERTTNIDEEHTEKEFGLYKEEINKAIADLRGDNKVLAQVNITRTVDGSSGSTETRWRIKSEGSKKWTSSGTSTSTSSSSSSSSTGKSLEEKIGEAIDKLKGGSSSSSTSTSSSSSSGTRKSLEEKIGREIDKLKSKIKNHENHDHDNDGNADGPHIHKEDLVGSYTLTSKDSSDDKETIEIVSDGKDGLIVKFSGDGGDQEKTTVHHIGGLKVEVKIQGDPEQHKGIVELKRNKIFRINWLGDEGNVTDTWTKVTEGWNATSTGSSHNSRRGKKCNGRRRA